MITAKLPPLTATLPSGTGCVGEGPFTIDIRRSLRPLAMPLPDLA